jgi:hypothetical protein
MRIKKKGNDSKKDFYCSFSKRRKRKIAGVDMVSWEALCLPGN